MKAFKKELDFVKDLFGRDAVSTNRVCSDYSIIIHTRRVSPALELRGYKPVYYIGFGLSHYQKDYYIDSPTLADFIEGSRY